MDILKAKKLAEELFINGFLVKFVPGFLITYGFLGIFPLHLTNEWLVALVITGISWTVGLVFENALHKILGIHSINYMPTEAVPKRPLLVFGLGLGLLLAVGLRILGFLISVEFTVSKFRVSNDVLDPLYPTLGLAVVVSIVLMISAIRNLKKVK